MKKSDVHALYRQVKSKKQAKKSTSFFDNLKYQRSGCKSCGKITWRPKNEA